MKLKKFEIALILGLVVTLFSGFTGTYPVNTLSDKVIRLHVVANSDTEEDQSLKIKVKERILRDFSDLLKEQRQKEDARSAILDALPKIKSAAADEIKKNGYAYTVDASLETIYFPTKDYDGFSLPAGEYEALDIRIGNAVGRNWWCVVFPPLCVTAAEGEMRGVAKGAGLSDDDIDFMTQANPKYEVKFKVAEIYGKLMHAIKG